MIIPYPVNLEGTLDLRDGTTVLVRPIRADDSALETRFVDGLSRQSRYQRFQYQMAHLTPKFLARFTHIDYDREMALVALAPDDGEFIGVARYAPNAGVTSAEFALTVADAWQGRGLGRALLKMLCDCARAAGYATLDGMILNSNRGMLALAEHCGFVRKDHDEYTVTVAREL